MRSGGAGGGGRAAFRSQANWLHDREMSFDLRESSQPSEIGGSSSSPPLEQHPLTEVIFEAMSGPVSGRVSFRAFAAYFAATGFSEDDVDTVWSNR